MRRIALALLLLCRAALAHASGGAADTTPDEQWFSVHLDGRKVGHMLQSRTVEGQRVTSRQLLSLTMERDGQPLTITSDEHASELYDGTPLAFETRIDTAGSVTQVRGQIEHARLRVAVDRDGTTQSQYLPWPDEALLAEGQRLAARRAGLLPGTQYAVLAFDIGSLRAVEQVTHVGAAEAVTIHGREEQLVPLQQTLWRDGAELATQAWVDRASGTLRRLRFPAVGLHLDVLACSRDCALAPVQPADVLDALSAPSPRPLRTSELTAPLAYRLVLSHGDGEALGTLPGQQLAPHEDGGLRLRVDPAGDARTPPTAADTAATRWLQSDADEVVTLAHDAAGDARDDAARMRNLERFVRGYVTTKSLRVGYASAAEVVRDREGDCTEHAVLLAALARALGIPARVATGIAYAPVAGARRHVFVPHAWVFAWIDGRWQGFDAALPRHDAGHIAFSAGDGDPFRFYEGIELLGTVTVQAVERLRWRERAQLRRARRAP